MYRVTASTLHLHTGYEDEYIRERLSYQTLDLLQDRDRSRCLLCGSQDLAVSHRVIAEHKDAETNPILCLTGHKLLPEQYEGNDLGNLMTLCEPHAVAYDEAAWRLVPAEEWRVKMAHAYPNRSQQNLQGELFDLVIFRPQDMPVKSIPRSVDSAEAAIVGAAFGPGGTGCVRVLRAWRMLPLDPFIVFAATLSASGGAYVPMPDDVIRAIEDACDTIREAWDAPYVAAPTWNVTFPRSA
ncbi:hypothetical protein BV20DRAFT_747643 [Pilatotrama ljubarskyi]|nr:hypothetical protein BV20DRAFT_747643 [Pilatotrama ljubarskyi]